MPARWPRAVGWPLPLPRLSVLGPMFLIAERNPNAEKARRG